MFENQEFRTSMALGGIIISWQNKCHRSIYIKLTRVGTILRSTREHIGKAESLILELNC